MEIFDNFFYLVTRSVEGKEFYHVIGFQIINNFGLIVDVPSCGKRKKKKRKKRELEETLRLVLPELYIYTCYNYNQKIMRNHS